MTTRQVDKTALVADTIIFTTIDTVVPDLINPSLAHNFVDIVSLDGSGNPVVPASGSYSIFVKTSEGSGFQSITDNGTIAANLTGGDAATDGTPISASFGSNAFEIKVVPATIVGAVSYKVTVRQNLT